MTRKFTVFVVAVVSVILALLPGLLMNNLLVSPPIFVLLFGSFVLQGLRKIPANPPHVGAETLYEKRTGRIIREGWHFFPFFPFVFGFIPVNIAKKNVNLDGSEGGDSVQLVRTPDMAEVAAPVHYTFVPGDARTDDEKKRDGVLRSRAPAHEFPKPIIAYLNSDGEEGVKNILSDIIAQELRTWGVDDKTVDPGLGRPRKSWEDVVRAGLEAVRALAAAISIRGGGPDLGAEASDVANGTRNMFLPTLGITLTRINVGEIEPTGELAKAAELMAKEKRDQKAETVELRHIRGRLKELMKAPPKGPGMTYGDAVELIQTEREKVVKTIDEKKLNVSPEAKAVVEGALTVALARLIPEGGE